MIVLSDKKNEYDLKQIELLSKKFGLFPETCEILLNRGIKTESEVEYFLNPGKHHFADPFTLGGVKEVVERVDLARNNGETVIVYGDYDVDGITATTVMTSVLREYGVETVIPFVPERADGYGLNTDTLDKLIEEYFPDLIITVDCGISCYKEVEYIKQLGVDVIVTDHHELPETLPDCPIVNCKIASEYGFTWLCGAGVAFKIACALMGKKAYKYLDLVALATIADSMPLIGENRDIVYEGVKFIKEGNACLPLKELIGVSNLRDVSSTGLAFTVAPRVNAAGRMGDSNSALTLMLSKDSQTINRLAIKLNEYNQARQQECDVLYRSAKDKLISSSYDKKIIILQDDKWNSGLVGIIAARLVEEFSRPVILFVNNDGKLHGSARSIDAINIYEAIFNCRARLTDFGGHSQAAGISLDISQYEAFKKDLEYYIDKTYDYSCFKPKKTVDLQINKHFSLAFAKQLSLLEPFGTGNKKPTFSIKTTDVLALPMKAGSSHLSIKTNFIDLLYFNGISQKDLLSSGAEKQIIFEPNVSVFNNIETLKGYVKDVDYVIEPSKKITLESFRQSLLTVFNENDDYLFVDGEEIEKIVDDAENSHFGTIFALFNPDTLEKYPSLKSLDTSLYETFNRNLVNNVVLGLTANNVNGYRRVVYLDRPLGAVKQISVNETFISRQRRAFNYSRLQTEKSVFGDLFKKIRDKEYFKAESSVDFALKCDLGYSKMQVVFAMEVFIEFGIFYFNKGYLRYNPTVKTNLELSKIYSEVEKLKY